MTKKEEALTEEVTVSMMQGYVELTVTSSLFGKPRIFATPATDALRTFYADIRSECKQPNLIVELYSGDSMISETMVHSFAWKPGRTLRLGDSILPVRLASDPGAGLGQDLDPSRLAGRKRSSSAMESTSMKYIVVTGGVISGLGKGITASSVGVLMKASGYRVTSIKIDPYLNVDAGTMSPLEHGEVFVLDDGGEADLDLGNYERFLGTTLTRDNNITAGKIYQSIVEKERKGDYLGKTVQVVPHVTDAIQDWIEKVAHIPVDHLDGPPDICIIEVGGTVGDIESMPFVEALRQFQFRVGRENICFMHVSLVPVMGVVGEEKTKPTQHSVRALRAEGIAPDFLVCRSSKPLSSDTRNKLAMFCHVPADHCLGVHDVSNIYRVPLLLNHQNCTGHLLQFLNLECKPSTVLSQWVSLAELVDSLKIPVTVAVVGKYTSLSDAYLSVSKSLHHAAYQCDRKLVIHWIESDYLEPQAQDKDKSLYEESWRKLESAEAVLVPGGFGDRGTEGKILAIKYAREKQVPFLGICLGFQLAVVEFARNILGWTDAHSAEFDEKTTHPVVIYMPEISKTVMGGTMRLGSRRTALRSKNCLTARLYKGVTMIDERHRHRYEVNPKNIKIFEQHGLEFVGQDCQGERMEVLELKGHPYFVGAQFHPEFKSRPGSASPMFYGLLLAASKQPLP